MAVEDLFTGPGGTVAQPDELLVAVDVPAPADGTGSCYVRLEYRRQMEIAVVGATAAVTLDGGLITEPRVAITALAPTIHRVPGGRGRARGLRRWSGRGCGGCRGGGRRGSAPISDVRASEAYRRAMAEVMAGARSAARSPALAATIVPIPASSQVTA